MEQKKALIFYGGWDGHEPEAVSGRFAALLEARGFAVRRADSLDCLTDREALTQMDLIVPCWTMGVLPDELAENVMYAVSTGVGLAGCHGGMCDAFRGSTRWQFMVGGQFVSHPGGDGTGYTVNICPGSSPITEGLEDFHVCSEQYYVHVDPCIEVLATTRFPNPAVNYCHISNKPVDVPVAWTKYWGNGRVFYQSLGHKDNVFDRFPTAMTLMERGMLWAAEGKAFAREHALTTDRYQNQRVMF